MIKSKHVILLIFIVTTIAIMAMTPGRSSSGAPAGHTGAPGEASCATIGCHDDNSINSGNAILNIDMGTATKYTPGQTYTIKVRITEPSIERFGFQLVALLNNDSSNAGTFLLSDFKRTQKIKSQYAFKDREYVTYTYEGTDAVDSGMSEWIVTWKAPLTNQGSVTFYASGVSANDDESDKGDYVITKSTVINPF